MILPLALGKEWWVLRGDVRRICHRLNFDITQDLFRQVCTLALIKAHVNEVLPSRRLRVIMIGDGFGVLAALFKEVFPESQIAMVDIGKTLIFQVYNCAKAQPNSTHHYAVDSGDKADKDFVYCPAEHLDLLTDMQFDLAVNVNSMQEMKSDTIKAYFSFLRKNLAAEHLFYCCNRECNELRGGEIVEYFKYPWQKNDHILMDEYCPWQNFFFAFNWPPRGVGIGPFKLPIINYYDGRAIHRLVVLANSE